MFTKVWLFARCLRRRTTLTLTLSCPRLASESRELWIHFRVWNLSFPKLLLYVYSMWWGSHFVYIWFRICPLTHPCVDFEQYFCTFNKWSSVLFNQLVSEVSLLHRWTQRSASHCVHVLQPVLLIRHFIIKLLSHINPQTLIELTAGLNSAVTEKNTVFCRNATLVLKHNMKQGD